MNTWRVRLTVAEHPEETNGRAIERNFESEATDELAAINTALAAAFAEAAERGRVITGIFVERPLEAPTPEREDSGEHPEQDDPEALEDEIAERAYQIYVSRNRGSAEENWRVAEEELRRERGDSRR